MDDCLSDLQVTVDEVVEEHLQLQVDQDWLSAGLRPVPSPVSLHSSMELLKFTDNTTLVGLS